MAPPWQTGDARLVERVRRGDGDAFDRIYERYQPSILAFCRHLTGHKQDAEDAVQHTFLSAYRQIVDSDRRLDLRPWLFTVARNRCLSLMRSARTRDVALDDGVERAVEGLALEVEQRQELRELMEDLGRLPEQQRAALLLSQLDMLSHREIGTMLGVAPEKVKALVFQARSSLASTREARDAPCVDIRRQLATSRGSALRRRTLRRHVHECQGCREFEAVVTRQRHDLSILLPVLPSVGLREAVFGGIFGREGASAVGGSATGATASGGAGAGLAGSLGALGVQGTAKLAIVGVIASGGAAGAVAADLPARIQGPPAKQVVATPSERTSDFEPVGDSKPPASGESGPTSDGGKDPGAGDKPSADKPESAGREGGGSGDEQSPSDDGESTDLPPGLAKKDGLPPGLAKKDDLSPGLAKKVGSSPAKAKSKPAKSKPQKSKDATGGNSAPGPGGQSDGGAGGGGGGGAGNGNSNSGAGNGNGNGGNGDGNGNGNGGSGGGNGNGGGKGNGNGNGGNNP